MHYPGLPSHPGHEVQKRQATGFGALITFDLGSYETLMQGTRFGPVVLPVTREVLRSVHGPVVRNEQGLFAFRYGGMGSLATLDAYYDIKDPVYDLIWDAAQEWAVHTNWSPA